MEQIIFDSEDGEQIPFFVIEETTINEIRYLLVTDKNPDDVAEGEEGEANILKCVETYDDEDVYEFVEDDDEYVIWQGHPTDRLRPQGFKHTSRSRLRLGGFFETAKTK